LAAEANISGVIGWDVPVAQAQFKSIDTIHVGDHHLPVANARQGQRHKPKPSHRHCRHKDFAVEGWRQDDGEHESEAYRGEQQGCVPRGGEFRRGLVWMLASVESAQLSPFKIILSALGSARQVAEN
jgi:hypothetical protein